MTAHTGLVATSLLLALAFIVAVGLERSRKTLLLPLLLTGLAAWSAVVLIALVGNHLRFPFDIDLLEGVIMQQAHHAMRGQAIYPLPSPEYVPLAYNALFPLLAAPFLLLFGDTLATLRTVSLFGAIGSAAAIFALVRASSKSAWWGAVAVGLFCAAYPAMDAVLDSPHSDSWLLCCALWGTYLVGRASWGPRLAGILVLAAGFWFKQHGAVFLLSALFFLTWREGIRQSLVYWLLAIVAAPLLYLFPPGGLLGPGFHYFTWQVPSGWSQFSAHSVYRIVRFIRIYYPVLAIAAFIGVYRALRSRTIGLLEMQLGAALLTALMGALDPGSGNNVFIPAGAFCIVYGSIELARIDDGERRWLGARLGRTAALLAFATLLYDPRPLWLPASARASYAELLTTIRALPGTVYAPDVGQLANGPRLYPAVHWIAVEDLMRGPHRTAADSALARGVLDPLRHPTTTAFVLTNHPLATMSSPVNELAPSYALVQDWGDRFAALAPVTRRADSGWPRYLYRFSGTAEDAHVH